MMPGWFLWLRHHHVPAMASAALLAGLGVRLGLTSISAGEGSLDVSPLWLATVLTIPLLTIFSSGDAWDQLAPRRLGPRRAALFAIALAVTLLGSLLFTPISTDGFDRWATWRDCLALMGIGLMGNALVHRQALWAAPLLASIGSMTFSWPLNPRASQTLWGALRAPSQWVMHGGSTNLSGPLCIAVAIAGIALHCHAPSSIGWSARRASTAADRSLPLPRAVRRANGQWPLAVVGGLTTAIICWGSVDTWGGSPRSLMARELPAFTFLLMPIASIIGVLVAQARWRSYTSVWQVLSGRSAVSLWLRAAGSAALTTTCAIGTPVLGWATVAGVDLAHHAGPTVAAREFLSGMPQLGMVLGEAVLVSTVATVVGWWMGTMWLAPLVFVLTAASMLALPRVPSQDIDHEWDVAYDPSLCVSAAMGRASVCTRAPLAGSLPAAASTLTAIYASAPDARVLPTRVELVDSGPLGLTKPRTSVPTLAMGRGHGLVPVSRLPAATVDTLAYSIQAWCPSTDITAVQYLVGSPYGRADTTELTQSVEALRRCRAQ